MPGSLIQQAQDLAATDPKALSTGLEIAEILRSLHCDEHTLAAGIAYPFVASNTPLTKTLHEHLDNTVCKIILGAIKMEVIHTLTVISDEKKVATGQQNQIDNLRKMMLAMVDDIRIILLKLSERLVALKTAHGLSTDLQKKMAHEVLLYYAPLANRLGITELKWQLEDLAFKYDQPEAYQQLQNTIEEREPAREKIITTLIADLKKLLHKAHLTYIQITGRSKHLYSIHKKLLRKDIGFEHLYDTSAVRIVVPTTTDCYTALSLVHNHYTPIPEEFDDYIAHPKLNGYQSIHTAIIRQDKTAIEIQIRTEQMHAHAELGVAAHWKYKENKSVDSTDEQKIILLRELLDWQKSTLLAEERQKHLYHEAFHDRAYVFSPAGAVFDLPMGATALDFAYLIHTDIGHRCRGAKINDALMPLTYPLKTGDRITILTSKEPRPSRDWVRSDLGYLKTQHAKQKVKQWFKKQDYDEHLANGIAQWEKIAHQNHLKKTDIEKIFHLFDLKNSDALLVTLGSNHITAPVILKKLESLNKKDKTIAPIITDPDKIKKTHTKTDDFSVEGAKHLLTQLAKCCHPIPGDDIIGYITKGRGISVHQKECLNIRKAMKIKPEKLMTISWENQREKNYRVSLTIECEDRSGLLRDISGLIAQYNLSIFAMNSHTNNQNSVAIITLTIEIKDLSFLEEVVKKLRQISGVMRVKRV
jgi:GTP pyrophosphokinase